MTQKETKLLFIDLSARVMYHPKILVRNTYTDETFDDVLTCANFTEYANLKYEVKPYLRSMSSMTEEEAKVISKLYGLRDKDILSLCVKKEYIEINVDDGFCSSEIKTLWYDEIVSSVEMFDYINDKHFDYRGLIPMGLALEEKQ